MSDAATTPGRWAIIEMMGHRRELGLVTEITFAGAPMLHIATPTDDPAVFVEKIVSPGSLYCVSIVTEERVRDALFPPARPALGTAGASHFFVGADPDECDVCGEEIGSLVHITDADDEDDDGTLGDFDVELHR